MNSLSKSIQTIGIALAVGTTSAFAQSTGADVSFKMEIERAIAKGNEYLKSTQKESGAWGDEKYPAISALAITAIMGDPNLKEGEKTPEAAATGYDFLLSNRKPDGGIYTEGLTVYNTALSSVAFLAANDDKYRDVILGARQYLITQQADYDIQGEMDNETDGGIGYGSNPDRADMSNTHFALEALYLTKQRYSDLGDDAGKDLNWDAAIQFINRTQNLPETNDLDYASDDPDNKGGFVYSPGDSKAGEQKLPNGKIALRSYGSMSYAGLLSFIYADVDKDDPRVAAVIDWVSRHYSVDENPNMGAQGLYYYYHTMAKGLSRAGIDKLTLKDGTEVNWRKDLALKVMSLQKSDGSWLNDESNRWMEGDRSLATSYMILTLEHIYHSL